ncbi:MAG: ferritin-like domain-containing protein [Janthinobacterium lividum]
MQNDKTDLSRDDDLDRDPVSGTPGVHPVGTGVGSASGALAGAAFGAMGGPAGALVGMVAGTIVGGMSGNIVAEQVNPTVEDAHWRENHANANYVEPGRSYDDYAPAYELGWSTRAQRPDTFEAAEPALATEWATRRGTSELEWPQARPATRAAWERADRTYFSTAGAVDADAGFDDGISDEPLANDEVADVLNDLLENARDGEYGFRASAEAVESTSLKQLFATRADGCRDAAAELVALIVAYGSEPADGGTTSGALHRSWVRLKGAVGANSELSILEEAERGEDAALARYRKALGQQLPADIRSVVSQQMQSAQRNHDDIERLRDQARERS